MKTLGCAVLAAIVAVGVANGEPAAVVSAGTAEIVIAADAPKTVRFAADEMKSFLGQVLAAEIPVVTAPTDGKTSIVLGSNVWSVAAGIDTAALKRDAFVIKVEKGRVYIAGRDDPKVDLVACMAAGNDWLPRNSEHATLFGVYAFLERAAGCRFYFPGEIGTVVPRKRMINLPAGEKTIAPVFLVRNPYMCYVGAARPGEPEELDEAARVKFRARLNAQDWMRLGLQTENIPCCHGQNGFAYVERFRESHPEYLRLKEDGTRATELEYQGDPHHWRIRDLCHTSKVWDEMYEDVKAYLTGQSAESRGIPSRRDPKMFAWNGNCVNGRYVDIMPQDGFQRCCCENCRKAYTDEPSYATDLIWGNTVRIANRLTAEGVKGFVTQMAYGPCQRIPDVKIPENVLVMVAQTGPWSVRKPEQFAKELDHYRAWAEKCGHKVWVWTYPHKFGETAIPDVPSLAPRAWGRYYQAASRHIFGSFAESETERWIYNYLNYYVFAKLGWNPGLDLDALLDDHYEKMFGAAAAEMKSFYEALEDAWFEVCGNIRETDIGPQALVPDEYALAAVVYSPAKLDGWARLLDRAEAKAAGDAPCLKRVRFMRAQLLDPLRKKMRAFADGISVEKAMARRAANPGVDILDHGNWSPYPREGAVPVFDSDVKGPTGANAIHIRAVGDKLYLSNVLDRPPHVLKPNTRYRFSCFLKAKDVRPTGRKGGIYIEVNNGPDNWAESNKTRIVGTTDWMYHGMEFKASGEIVEKPYVVLRILNATGEAWFDGVRLEEVK